MAPAVSIDLDLVRQQGHLTWHEARRLGAVFVARVVDLVFGIALGLDSKEGRTTVSSRIRLHDTPSVRICRFADFESSRGL